MNATQLCAATRHAGITACAAVLFSGAISAAEPPPEMGDVTCLLEPSKIVELSSQQPGIVKKVRVERGDPVKRGHVVVQLADGVEQAVRQLAQARYDFGIRKGERNQELVAKELISSQEMDEMQTEVAVAAAELEEAKERLKLRTITSPISGVVLERFKSPGDYVGEDPMLKLVDIDPLNVEVIVPVEALGRITRGMRATVTPDVIGGEYEATVTIVDPTVDPTSDTYGVRLKLDNPDNKIPAGLKCQIAFDWDSSE